MWGRGKHARPKTPAELNIELESRDAYSAVALGLEHGGGLASHECYRCLTTTSRLWHQYGKLNLTMCNGCVVLMDVDLCGWCGTNGEEKGRTLANCHRCRRPIHEVIHQSSDPDAHVLTSPSTHSVCILRPHGCPFC